MPRSTAATNYRKTPHLYHPHQLTMVTIGLNVNEPKTLL